MGSNPTRATKEIVMEDMLDQLEQFMDLVLKRKSLFEKVAKAYKATLDSLMAEGFTREEAILILANQGMGVKGSN